MHTGEGRLQVDDLDLLVAASEEDKSAEHVETMEEE